MMTMMMELNTTMMGMTSMMAMVPMTSKTVVTMVMIAPPPEARNGPS